MYIIYNVITILQNVMNLKERKRGIWKALEEGKGRKK